jgi:hypothetical protein
MLAFAEAGNTWQKIKDFDPFAVKRAAGSWSTNLPAHVWICLVWITAGASIRIEKNPFAEQCRLNGRFAFTIGMNLGEL